LISVYLGAFNSTRESQRRSQLAQRKVDGTQSTVDESMKTRDVVERMIEDNEDSFNQKITENQQDLDEVDGQIGGLEDKIAELNKIVCFAKLWP
jgi:septal ring factor EnvC (AmiA/AmiB activator)